MHGIRLPPPYRAFLSSVGDGGVGPGYGLQGLSRWRSVELPGGLARVELGDAAATGLRVVDAGGVEATVLLVTGPHSGRLVDVGAGVSARLRPEEDFLSWYAAWLESADLPGVAPRGESVLVEVLSTADEAERIRAVHELGALDALSDDTVGLVGSLALRDPSSRVRYQAVELLGELGDEVVGVLVGAVRDGKRSVGRRALVHVMRLAGATPAWQEALGAMRSTGDDVGVRIAEDLESRRLLGAVLPPGGA
ncbi:HEAT repeat domain-containing protein [Saccharothrix syringae]|uniref:HEAT repeat domain-containing protein n=1 Tax=Saccharothrix syringae TaxID=103733 RepID=A0A5Q0GWD6_SACSY|nr:HEAT repeat domain-containing protein [Saccharothrix syringae]QFZ17780.1 HEAT repeat domain-containing protein [Saccharothrix syringae]